jgi:2-phosphoglycerate kinase
MNIYHDFLLEQNKKYNINILSDIDLELVDDIVDYLNKLNENLVDKSHKCEC